MIEEVLNVSKGGVLDCVGAVKPHSTEPNQPGVNLIMFEKII